MSSDKILCFSNGVLSQAGGSYEVRPPKDADAATSAALPKNVEVASIRVAKEKVELGMALGLGDGVKQWLETPNRTWCWGDYYLCFLFNVRFLFV